MMIANVGKPRWFFYPEWVVLNAITVVLAAFIAWTLVSQAVRVLGGTIQVAGQTRITEDYLLLRVLFPTVGLMTGLLQYALLRRHLTRPGWWIVATLLGWLLPFVFGALFTIIPIPNRLIGSLRAILVMALLGVMIGLPQWWVLRRQVGHAAWWILAYGFGWGIIALLNSQTSTPLVVLLSLATFPAIATSFAWWLLLDWLPKHALEAGGVHP